MTKDDLHQIDELLKKRLNEEISASEQRLKEEISVTEHSLQDQISTSEKRLIGQISVTEQSLREEIHISDGRVMTDIGSFMEDNLFPMIEKKADKSDINRLERKLDKSVDTNLDHERRIKDIEQIPMVAHELKIKRAK